MQRHLGRLVAILAVIGLFFLASGPVPAEAQAGAAGAQAIPRAPDGKPDFSGFWDQPHKPGTRAAGATVFDKATMPALRAKSEKLTGYLEYLLDRLPAGYCTIVTPREPARRGAQLSLRIKGDSKGLLKQLVADGVYCDFREPDIIRVAPAPLYNRFEDVFRFARVLEHHAGK